MGTLDQLSILRSFLIVIDRESEAVKRALQH